MNIKEKFENSFKGYHKDAPKYLKSKSKALGKVKEPKWKIESGKKVRKAFAALAKKNDNWETKDTL